MSMETAPCQCRLCKRESSLVRSHIIPRSFFEIDPKEPLRIVSNAEGVFPKKAPMGVYDRIVCEECERSFSDYDAHAADILLNRRDRWQTIQHDGNPLAYIVPDADYRLLKLFAISVAWRASVSTHVFYCRVDLGPFADRAREMLLAREPGDTNTFATWWSFFISNLDPGIMDPFRERWSGVNAYRFYLGRVLAYVKVDRQPVPPAFAEFALSPDRPLTLVGRKFENSKDLSAMKRVVLENQLRHGDPWRRAHPAPK